MAKEKKRINREDEIAVLRKELAELKDGRKKDDEIFRLKAQIKDLKNENSVLSRLKRGIHRTQDLVGGFTEKAGKVSDTYNERTEKAIGGTPFNDEDYDDKMNELIGKEKKSNKKKAKPKKRNPFDLDFGL